MCMYVQNMWENIQENNWKMHGKNCIYVHDLLGNLRESWPRPSACNASMPRAPSSELAARLPLRDVIASQVAAAANIHALNLATG